MRNRNYLWLFLFLGAALIAWKLYQNKQQLAAETRFGEVTAAYVPVEVALPKMETLANHLEADGIFLAAKEMFVISETAGRVVEVYKNKGEWVNEGDLIAKVDDEVLRIELAGSGVRVGLVAPGTTTTEIFAEMKSKGEPGWDEFIPSMVPDDIARAILFMCEQTGNANAARLHVYATSEGF